jgi:hypothetical protein
MNESKRLTEILELLELDIKDYYKIVFRTIQLIASTRTPDTIPDEDILELFDNTISDEKWMDIDKSGDYSIIRDLLKLVISDCIFYTNSIEDRLLGYFKDR